MQGVQLEGADAADLARGVTRCVLQHANRHAPVAPCRVRSHACQGVHASHLPGVAARVHSGTRSPQNNGKPINSPESHSLTKVVCGLFSFWTAYLEACNHLHSGTCCADALQAHFKNCQGLDSHTECCTGAIPVVCDPLAPCMPAHCHAAGMRQGAATQG